jgi:hypothetical protein
MSITDTVTDIVPDRTFDRLADLAELAGPTAETVVDVAGTVTETVVDVADVAVDAAGRSVFRIVGTVRERPAHAAVLAAAVVGVVVAFRVGRRRSTAADRTEFGSSPHVEAA